MAKISQQVMLGIGEQYLETIGQEAKLWHFFTAQTNYLTNRSEELRNNASLIGEEVIRAAFIDGSLTDFEGLARKLDETQGQEIICSYLAGLAIQKLTSLDQNSNLGYDKQARLTVLKSGVHGKKFLSGQEPHAETLVKTPQLEIDDIARGTICDLRTRPELGGVIGLRRMWSTIYIYGLVNPVTGDPRVKLEVMAEPKS